MQQKKKNMNQMQSNNTFQLFEYVSMEAPKTTLPKHNLENKSHLRKSCAPKGQN